VSVRSELDPPVPLASPGSFVTTRWTMIFAAGGKLDPSQPPAMDERAALERLCRTYWPPVYAFLRRQGLNPEDAHDLAQEFFFRLIERQGLRLVDPLRGRFRNWLLSCLKNFMVGEWKRNTAQKRDQRRLVWLDGQKAESGYQAVPASGPSPEVQYQRDFAMALVESARQRLEQECQRSGRKELFAHVQHWLVDGPEEGGYAELAAQLGTTPGSLKVTVHRWRRRWAELLREALEEQLDGPNEQATTDELTWLLGAMTGPT
jgi:RNA polymerase sigma factor (sigma-70 family)